MKTYLLGESVLDFTVLDHRRRWRRLSELAREPLVLTFYRGHWCPYCVRHLAELAEHHRQIRNAGANQAALSVDEPEASASLARDLELPFPLLCDPDKRATASWGLIDERERGGIAHPATFIVAPDLSVLFRVVGTKKRRTEPQSIIRYLHTGARFDSFGGMHRVLPHPRGYLRNILDRLGHTFGSDATS